MMTNRLGRRGKTGRVFFFKQKTAYGILAWLEFRRVLFRSMRAIAVAAVERHGLCAAAVEHRVGTVPLSEPSVLVAVSAAHRGEAFAGAREIIDEVKARAPKIGRASCRVRV